MSDKSNLVTHYSSVFMGAIASLSFSEFVSLCFLLIGLATFIMNWYYKHQDHQLKIRKAVVLAHNPTKPSQ